MGKGSSVVSILALIISIGIGGYLVYDNFIVTQPVTPEISTRQWYDYYKWSMSTPSGLAWSTSNFLMVEFNVSEGESVYFSYTGTVYFDDQYNDTWVELCFKVDGIRWPDPLCKVERINTEDPGIIYLSVALQHVNSTLSMGDHNVTVTFRSLHGGGGTNSVREQNMFVQTFN